MRVPRSFSAVVPVYSDATVARVPDAAPCRCGRRNHLLRSRAPLQVCGGLEEADVHLALYSVPGTCVSCAAASDAVMQTEETDVLFASFFLLVCAAGACFA